MMEQHQKFQRPILLFDEFISLKKLQLLLGPPGPSGRMGKMAKIWTWPYGPSYGPYEAFDRMDRMVLQASQVVTV